MKPSLFVIIALSWLLNIPALLVDGSAIQAQQPVNIHLTEKEGLPDREFYGVAEDSKGFIWLAGNKGLTRFDGSTFVTLENKDKRGLSVFEVSVANDDRVWCINISGQLFYSDGESLTLFADLKQKLRGSLADVLVSDDYLVISTQFVIIAYNLKTNKQVEFDIADNTHFGYPTLINGIPHFMVDNTLYSLQNDVFTAVKSTGTNLFADSTTRIGSGTLLSIENKGLFFYHINDAKETQQFLLEDNRTIGITFPKEFKNKRITAAKKLNETIWFLTEDGAFATTLIENTIVVKNHFLPGIFTTDVSEDADGNLWFTTLKNGVYVLPNIYIKEVTYPSQLEQPSSMIMGKDNQLVIGFNSGNVLVNDLKNSQQTVVNIPSNRTISSLGYDASLDAYHYLQDVNTYIAQAQNPTALMNKKSRVVAVKKIIFLEDETIAYVNAGEAVLVSKENYGKLPLQAYARFYKNKRGYTCYKNKQTETLYFGLVDELIAVDSLNKSTPVKTIDGNDILTQSISSTADSFVWAGTFTEGIYKIKNNQVIAHLNTTNGLLSNRINAIAADGDNLWIATDAGIQLMQRDKGQGRNFKNLKKQDGIPSYDVKDIVVQDSLVYFCSSSSVFEIDKTKAFRSFKEPEIYFTQISINKQSQAIKTNYTIKESESAFEVRFNANGFRGLSSGRYQYRLKGFDNLWKNITNEVNTIQYASLAEGDFKFQLRAAPQGESVSEVKEIDIRVVKPWYASVLLWLFVMAGVVVALLSYFRRKLKSKEAQRQKEKAQLQLEAQLTSLKLENLQSQMNPHFIFNALNSIQEYIVHNERDLASDYLVKFSRLIRMYLDQSRENSIALDEEIEAMQLYLQLEKVRFEDKLEYKIHLDKHYPSHLKVPPLFIQPYVENALKHGLLHRKSNRKLDVAFAYSSVDNELQITVLDNGIGRVAAQEKKARRPQEHTSFATQANDSRVALLNQNRDEKIVVTTNDLYDGDTALGTKISIVIPQ